MVDFAEVIRREKSMNQTAYLNLEKYLEIVEWDHGYIVVISKNYNREQEEDYIDLVPILKNLLIEPQAFLEPIKEVKVRYA